MSAADVPDEEMISLPSVGQRFALVVGCNNSSCVPPNWATLQSAEKDARDVAYHLEQPTSGFKLLRPAIIGKDATVPNIRQAMKEFVKGRAKDDFLLFYFSGHATPKKRNVFFVTHDFNKEEIDLDRNWYLSMRWLGEVLYQVKGPGCVLIILDCCYAGNMAYVREDFLQVDLSARFDAYEAGTNGETNPNQSRLILAAAGYNEQAEEINGQGQMTRWLIKALAGNEEIMDQRGVVDVYSLHQFLFEHMPKDHISPLSGEIARKFVLAHHPLLSVEHRKSKEKPIIQRILEHTLEIGDYLNHQTKTNLKTKPQFLDKMVCEGALFEHLESTRVAEFFNKALVRQEEKFLPGLPEQEQLERLGLLQDAHPTYGALLCFGEDPSRWVTSAITRCIDSGNGKDSDSWLANKKNGRGLLRQFDESCDFLVKRLDSSRIIKKGGSADQLEIPYGVLREALANALVHREYEDRADCIIIEIYSDRVEISNPGDLPQNMSLESLLTDHGSHPRNPQIAEIFHLYGAVEERGKGIERMRRFMVEAGLPEPKFEVSQDKRFKVTLYRPIEVPKEVVLSETFGELLTQGIEGIAKSGKPLDIIKHNLISETNIKDIVMLQKWLQGFVPTQANQVKILARKCVQQGKMSKEWLYAFLEEAHYSSSESLIDELFPSSLPHNMPNFFSGRGWFSLLIMLVAIGPPAAISVANFPTLIHNPLPAAGLLLLYELMVGIITLFLDFLRKIWERRADTWADAGAGRLETLFSLLFFNAQRRYRTFFCYEHRDLDMKGISTRGTYTLDLEEVFVEFRIDPIPAHRASTDPIHFPAELRAGAHDIWDYLTLLDQHLVILGAPGSGKTTLLKHLGLCLLQNRRWRQARARRLPWTVPLWLPLREHSAVLEEQADYSLVDAASRQIRKWRQPIPSTWILHLLRKGRCLVLLDGLDEIADTAQRQRMAAWVQNQMLAYGTNRFVIASRPLGYLTNPLEHVSVLEAQPFTFDQMTQFLRSWYLANEIKRAVRDDPGVRMKAQEGAEDLLKRLSSTATLLALAVNPLLLTMIATVHLYYGTLPGARVTLYKAICEVFFDRRHNVLNSSQELRAAQRQRVVQPLAYALMEMGRRDVSRQDACQLLKAPLLLVSPTLTPEIFLDHLESISSGLLLEREQGVYSFAHLTFQEYLAMSHVQEQHLEHELLTHINESWWHETIRLFCAQADATAILEACLLQADHSLGALVLAIDCAEEALTVQAEVKECLYTLLEQGVNNANPELRRVVVQALLQRRLRQMILIMDGIYIDTSLITCAEYQEFLDEQLAQGNEHTPVLWKSRMFPQNEGHTPVSGIQVTDAQAFCQWLNNQYRGRGYYRLPRQKELKRIKENLPETIDFWYEQESLYLLSEQAQVATIPSPHKGILLLKEDLANP